MSEFAKASFKKRVLARVLVRPQQEPAQKPPYGTWSQGGLGGPCSGGIQAPFRHHPPPRGGGGYSLRRTANRAPCMMVKTIVAPVRTFRPRRRTGLVCVVFVVRTGCAHGGEDVKIQTCALLKFLTILERRLRITIMIMMVMMMNMMLVIPNDMTRKDK